MSEPPLYKSFDEEDKGDCIFCKDDIENPVLYGDKYKYDNLTLHHFCSVSDKKKNSFRCSNVFSLK